jgi:hypothetical protein
MIERKCPFTGCGKAIPAEMFACKRHRFMLSQEQRDRIWAMYRDWQSGDIDGETLTKLQQEVLDETGVGGTA